MSQKPITPCLWFDNQAEEAANFYTAVFKNSKISQISRFGKEGFDKHGQPEGRVMVVSFTINGQEFTALNGGPNFKFNESVSFQILCDDQEEIDYYWNNLTKDGGQESMCGWCKDKFGLSWQVIPSNMGALMSSDPARSERVTKAFMQMRKLDIATLRNA